MKYKSVLSILLALLMLVACTEPAVNENTASPSGSPSGDVPVITGSTQPQTSANTAENGEPAKLEEDFYSYVNADWLAETEIEADKTSVSAFSELSDGIDQTLMTDLGAMADGGKQPGSDEMSNAVELYRQAMDFEAREKAGVEPLKKFLDKIDAVDSIQDIVDGYAEWDLGNMPSPITLGVGPDMADTSRYLLHVGTPALFMMDKSYYAEDNPSLPIMKTSYTNMSKNLLVMTGYDEAEAEKIATQAMEFDALIAPLTWGMDEISEDYTKTYNPMTIGELAGMSELFDFSAAIQDVLGELPETVVVSRPEYIEGLDELTKEDNFEIFKSWMIVQTVNGSASALTEEMRVEADSFSMLISGRTESMPQDEAAYGIANGVFSEVLGKYYGETYFGEEAKQDVTKMVEAMVAVYESRLQGNEWLSQETKDMAIKKLETMKINVGYPDKLHPVYGEMKPKSIEDGGNMVDNMMLLSRQIKTAMYEEMKKPVDKDEWIISGHVVNAMYSPTNNSINFPAAILQEPYYSLEYSASQNYGGIGAVIAHEISHAFDPNGSKFDENGNMNNWWTQEDYDKFDELSQAVKEQYDGLEHAGGTVNGTLTLAENIADIGGLACAIEAAKQEDEVDMEQLFTNWATVWRMKARPEFEALLLTLDSHSPNKVRGNQTPKNMDEFYEAFGLEEGDGMYLAPDDRIEIW